MYYQFHTERLFLRPLSPSDLDTVHNYTSDLENSKFMFFCYKRTVDETLEFLLDVRQEWNKTSPIFYEFAVCLDGKHIGAVSIYLQECNSGELGWILDRRYHNNGYATEAAKCILNFAKSLGLRRVFAHCDTRNVASRRVMEKLGMTFSHKQKRTYPDERGVAEEYEYVLDL